jgi:hypothetical protein
LRSGVQKSEVNVDNYSKMARLKMMHDSRGGEKREKLEFESVKINWKSLIILFGMSDRDSAEIGQSSGALFERSRSDRIDSHL